MSELQRPRPTLIDLLLVLGFAATALIGIFGGAPQEERGDPHPAVAVDTATAEMTAVGNAMLSWLSDQVSLQRDRPVSFTGTLSCFSPFPTDFADYDPITHADLEDLLVPDYIAAVPELDPWGNAYDYRINLTDLFSSRVLAIRTAGADGVYEGSVYAGGFTADPDGDQVWADGLLVHKPPKLDPISLQCQTESDMQRVGVALLSWLTDQVSLGPQPGPSPEQSRGTTTFDLTLMQPRTHAEIVGLLIPSSTFFYIHCVPETDGWGNPYEYFINANLLASQEVIAVRSRGADGTVEGNVYSIGTSTPGDDFHRDLVWGDGFWIQSPDGTHSLIFSDDFETGDLWGTWSCQ